MNLILLTKPQLQHAVVSTEPKRVIALAKETMGCGVTATVCVERIQKDLCFGRVQPNAKCKQPHRHLLPADGPSSVCVDFFETILWPSVRQNLRQVSAVSKCLVSYMSVFSFKQTRHRRWRAHTYETQSLTSREFFAICSGGTTCRQRASRISVLLHTAAVAQ